MTDPTPLRFALRHGDTHGFAVARLIAPSALLLEAFPLPPPGAELFLTPRFGALPTIHAIRAEVHTARTSTTLEPSAFSRGLRALDHRGPGVVVILRAIDLVGEEVAVSEADLRHLGLTLPIPPARLLPLPTEDGSDRLRALPEPPSDLAALARALGRDLDTQHGAGQAEEFGLEAAAGVSPEARARLLFAADETPRPLQADADSDEDEFGPRRRGLTGFLSTLLRRTTPRR